MKIDSLSIIILFLININFPVIVRSEPLVQQEIGNVSCTVQNDNSTLVKPDHPNNPVEYGDLRNYLPGIVSQIASIAIQSVTNDRTEIAPEQKEITSHVEGSNRIKKTIERPPLRNNLIIIGKSDDSRMKFMPNCDNTEVPRIIPSTECTSEKLKINDHKFVGTLDNNFSTKNVKVQLDIPTDMKVCFNMEVQNGTEKLKSSGVEKDSDFPFKFSKPCVNDKGKNTYNLTTDEKMNHSSKCVCSHTSNKRCECCSLNNQPNTMMEEDISLIRSGESNIPSINDPKSMMKQEISSRNAGFQELKQMVQDISLSRSGESNFSSLNDPKSMIKQEIYPVNSGFQELKQMVQDMSLSKSGEPNFPIINDPKSMIKQEISPVNSGFQELKQMVQDMSLSKSGEPNFPSIEDPKSMIKQDISPDNGVLLDLKQVRKRSDLPSNRNNIIIIGKDDVRENPMCAPTSTLCEGLVTSKKMLDEISSNQSNNNVKVHLDVPMDSRLSFNITVTNGTTDYKKCQARFSDSVYPKLSLAALKSVLRTYEINKTHTGTITHNPSYLTTNMEKENTTTVYSQDSSTHKILDNDFEEEITVKGKIDSVSTSPLRKKSRKKLRKVCKGSGKTISNKTDGIHKSKLKNISGKSTNLLGDNNVMDIKHSNIVG